MFVTRSFSNLSPYSRTTRYQALPHQFYLPVPSGATSSGSMGCKMMAQAFIVCLLTLATSHLLPCTAFMRPFPQPSHAARGLGGGRPRQGSMVMQESSSSKKGWVSGVYMRSYDGVSRACPSSIPYRRVWTCVAFTPDDMLSQSVPPGPSHWYAPHCKPPRLASSHHSQWAVPSGHFSPSTAHVS